MRFSSRIGGITKSYTREILKIAENKEFISFAGGLPNPEFFPIQSIIDASKKVLLNDGKNVLQYGTPEGYKPLREFIVNRYYKNMDISPDDILITNGSQQGLELIGKLFLDKGDSVLIEKPGYLGAFQTLAMFEVQFETIDVDENGINIEALNDILTKKKPKIFYTVSNFQNPTGLTYSNKCRKKIVEVLEKHDTYMVDDNPYGELRFEGEQEIPMKQLSKNKVISLGSFSKIFAPGMRLGWVCGSSDLMDELIALKQASDIHTNYYAQRVLYQYLLDNDIDEHINTLRKVYKEKRDCMVEALSKYMPANVEYTIPNGGMFLWVTLPENVSVQVLLEKVMSRKVAFVPGNPFYVNDDEVQTLRLNYTNSDNKSINDGIRIIAEVIKKMSE